VAIRNAEAIAEEARDFPTGYALGRKQVDKTLLGIFGHQLRSSPAFEPISQHKQGLDVTDIQS
jgi:hypothetical protein